MAGPSVVISTRGGLPVRSVTEGAPVLTVSPSGKGVPIVLTDRGAPFIVEGLTPSNAPVNTVIPVISGLEKVGSTLTTDSGTWTGAPTITYAYGWEFSLTGGAPWSSVGGAVDTLALTAAEEGGYIRSKVTATNPDGSAVAYSINTAQIAGTGADIPAPFDEVLAAGWEARWDTAIPSTKIIEQPFTVKRKGFNNIGQPILIPETMYVTVRQRQAYPNDTLLSPNLVALSGYIYAGDEVVGATNNSTELSPKPHGMWASIDRRVIGNTLELATYWVHRDANDAEPIRTVRYDVTDGVNSLSHYCMDQTIYDGGGTWAIPTPVWLDTINVSSLNDGLITVTAIAYPNYGDDSSIASTADNTDNWLMTNQYYWKDPVKAANPPIAVVNRDGAKVVNGISYGAASASGVVSTDPNAARAAPFDSINTALTAIVASPLAGGFVDGCEVWIASNLDTAYSQNPLNSGADRPSRGFAPVIARDPNIDWDSAVIGNLSGSIRIRTGTLAAPLTSWTCHLRDIKYTRTTSGNNLQNGTTGSTMLDYVLINCRGNHAGNTGTLAANNVRNITYWGGEYTPFSTWTARTHGYQAFVGVKATGQGASAAANSQFEALRVFGCDFDGFNVASTSALRGNGSNSVIAYSSFYRSYYNNSVLLAMGGTAGSIQNVGVVNVLVENEQDGTRSLRFSGDGTAESPGASMTNIVLHNITTAGRGSTNGGWNNFYDESPSGFPRTHKLISMKGCITGSVANKSDTFIEDGARKGNWPYMMGVDVRDNFVTGDTGYGMWYNGLGTVIQDGVTYTDPLFVDPKQGVNGGPAGAGRGDYRLQPTSGAINLSRNGLTFSNLDGNTRSASINNTGAY